MQARARLIWTKSTAAQRRSLFAMGVGLNSGLTLDAVAPELIALLDFADSAAMRGDAKELSTALVEMAKHLFKIRPFVPDADLPEKWNEILARWIGGIDVAEIGLDNMRIVEEAFIYRLTWAIEALRMRRRAEGGQSEFIEGSAAACLESGLPQIKMAMLVRAGLSSRVAAREAVKQTKPTFNTRSEMNSWLSSNAVIVLSEGVGFPTPETSEIWKRFREEALATPIQKWNEQDWELAVSLPAWVSGKLPARIVFDEQSGRVSIASADFREIIGIRQTLTNPAPSLLQVNHAADLKKLIINRIGRGRASWRA